MQKSVALSTPPTRTVTSQLGLRRLRVAM